MERDIYLENLDWNNLILYRVPDALSLYDQDSHYLNMFISSRKIEDIDTYVHEFTEASLIRLVKNLKTASFITDITVTSCLRVEKTMNPKDRKLFSERVANTSCSDVQGQKELLYKILNGIKMKFKLLKQLVA